MLETIGKRLKVDLVPQAEIALPVKEVVGERARIVPGEDGLDRYEGSSFRLDDLLFAVRHYRGHPRDTATLYMERRVRDVEEITRLIRKILKELHVPVSALTWERKLDPDL
jgi:hypothetical protein